MKRSNTRRALMMSVLSLLLCASMLIGTTFAWFTDTVVSDGNIIKSGKLDISFGWADGTQAVPTTDAGWTDASAGPMFKSERWEPGYAEAKHIRIKNEGNLALKYVVTVVADGAVSDLADVIDVYYLDPAKQIETRTALAALTPMGTLADALRGLPLSGGGNLLEGETFTGTIVLKMQEDAGNYYQEMSIGTTFSVKVFATQFTEETDSFGNDYDTEATYPANDLGVKGTAPLTLEAEEVAVTVPAEAPAGEYTLNVSNKTVNETAEGTEVSFDIDLLRDGVKVTSSGEMYLVKIDIGAGHTKINKVLHKGAIVASYNYDFVSGIISFETDSFSPFAVSYEAAETQWSGEFSTEPKEEMETVKVDEDARIIYVSGAEGFTYLNTLAKNWSSYVSGYNSYYYVWTWDVVLLTDVDLGNKPFTSLSFPWRSFDGQGHTVSGLYVEGRGLFDSIGVTGTVVKDLTIENAFVDGNTYEAVGTLAGIVNGKIDNVHVKNASVKGDKYVGGLVGKCLSDIKNCSVTDATVTMSNNAKKTIGGLVGYAVVDGIPTGATTYIKNNTVTDTTVMGTYNVGGLIGQLQGSSDSINASANTLTRVSVVSTDELPASASADEKRAEKVAARVVGKATLGENTTTDVTVTAIVTDPTAVVPSANVVAHPEYVNTPIEWNSTTDEDAQLEAVYSFTPKQSAAEAAASKYADWHADFRVSIDRDIAAGDIFLGGNYGPFEWVGFASPEPVPANTKVCLLAYATGGETSGWAYEGIVTIVQDFLCGVSRTQQGWEKLTGATFTVELILTNPETSEVVVVNTTTHTFA